MMTDRHPGEGSKGRGCPPPLMKILAYGGWARCKMVLHLMLDLIKIYLKEFLFFK